MNSHVRVTDKDSSFGLYEALLPQCSAFIRAVRIIKIDAS
jgi:hypothetical protein